VVASSSMKREDVKGCSHVPVVGMGRIRLRNMPKDLEFFLATSVSRVYLQGHVEMLPGFRQPRCFLNLAKVHSTYSRLRASHTVDVVPKPSLPMI
jgi:hypothetical protein